MIEENIEVRYLETEQDMVNFFELSPGELKEMTAKYPLPEGKLSPKAAADWYISIMQHEIIDLDESIRKALRPPPF